MARLNVLLHGTFTFVPAKDEEGNPVINALIPTISSHVYRAGNWLGETDLKEGTYTLRGVQRGSRPLRELLDPAKNLIVKGGKERSAAPYATLTFPIPEGIASLRVASVPTRVFNYPEALVNQGESQSVATLQIFTYNFDDDSSLLLASDSEGQGHYWEPVFVVRDFINLHVFSTEDHFSENASQINDFAESMKLAGSNLALKQAYEIRAMIPRDFEGKFEGVAAEETEDLAPRTQRLARLGRLVAQRSDANRAWYSGDPLGTDPGCGGFWTPPGA